MSSRRMFSLSARALAAVVLAAACGEVGDEGPLPPVQGAWIDVSLTPEFAAEAARAAIVAAEQRAAGQAAQDDAEIRAAAQPAADARAPAGQAPVGDESTGRSADGSTGAALAASAAGDRAGQAPAVAPAGVVAPPPPPPGAAPGAAESAGPTPFPYPDDAVPLEIEFAQLDLPDGSLPEIQRGRGDDAPPIALTAEVAALDGRLVSLEGFLIPTDQAGSRLRRFALSYDPPGCCFGQAGSIDKWVVVELDDDAEPVEYSYWAVARVEGVLSVGERRSEYGHVESLYRLRGRRAELIE